MEVDELTGLMNRRKFLLALRRHVLQSSERNVGMALLVVDIDKFSAVNGVHGFDFGDRLLQHMAMQLNQVARETDLVARIGDNRFALILTRIMNRGHVELAVQKLFRLLDMPFETNIARMKIAATVGVAMCPQHASQAEYLLRLAERAIHSARIAGQRFLFPPDSETEELSESWDMEIELSGALQRGELEMHYQPKVGCMDLRPVGVEALMRWTNHARGLLMPDVFIPIAEHSGQIKALTIWALNTSLRQASEWKHPFGRISVAVNVPAEMVSQHDLPDLVENALNLWGSEAVQLTLEITERSLVSSPEHSFKILSRIRAMGVKVSIDDFGTGYSCLAYFKNIPADELKIDQSFVMRLLDDSASSEIASLIIELAHRFGLSVVGEGVEAMEVLRVLQERKCDVAQGFLVAKAMSNDDIQRWLNNPTFAETGQPLDPARLQQA